MRQSQGVLMETGLLTERIALQNATYTVPASGQRVPTFSTFATVWANAKSLPGQETEIATQQKATERKQFTIRVSPDALMLTAQSRVVLNSKAYYLAEPPRQDETKTWIEFVAAGGAGV